MQPALAVRASGMDFWVDGYVGNPLEEDGHVFLGPDAKFTVGFR